MKKLNTLELIGYNTSDILGDETDLMDELKNSDYSYVCDGVCELSDNFCPIHNSDIWENVKDISEWVEEAIEQGIADISKGLEHVFQCGYYLYYQSELYNNLEAIAYNVLADYVNNTLEEQLQSIQEDEEIALDFDSINENIEDYLQGLSSEFDHNDSWDDLKNELVELITTDCIIEEEDNE